MKNQKGFAPIIILLVIALAIGGYFAYQNMQLKKSATRAQQTPVPSTTYTPSPSATTDPTADWKILKTTHLYLRYPDTLIGCVKNNPVFEDLSVRTTENCNSSGAPENILGISKIPSPAEDQLYGYLKDLNIGEVKSGMTEGEKMAGVEYKRGKDLAIGDSTTKTYIQSSTQNVQNNVLTIYSYITSPKNELYFVSQTYINSNPNKYNINFAKTFDQILSTFKFLDQGSETDKIIDAAKLALTSFLGEQLPGNVALAENSLKVMNDWAFGSIVIPAPENVHGGPSAWNFLARKINGVWQASIEYTQTFKDWLRISPDGLVNPDYKKLML